MSTASKVAQAKLDHPEDFCPHPRCLWRTSGGFCPRHEPQVRCRNCHRVCPVSNANNYNCPFCGGAVDDVLEDEPRQSRKAEKRGHHDITKGGF